jgi:hypothetical protein
MLPAVIETDCEALELPVSPDLRRAGCGGR